MCTATDTKSSSSVVRARKCRVALVALECSLNFIPPHLPAEPKHQTSEGNADIRHTTSLYLPLTGRHRASMPVRPTFLADAVRHGLSRPNVGVPLRSLVSGYGGVRAVSSNANLFPRTIASLLYPATEGTDESTEGSPKPQEENVTINGWVRSVRRMKSVSFAHISDGSSTTPLQAVLTKEQAAGSVYSSECVLGVPRTPIHVS